MDGLRPGQVLEVLADDQGIRADMVAWCRRTGNDLLSTEESEGRIRLLVKKAGSAE